MPALTALVIGIAMLALTAMAVAIPATRQRLARRAASATCAFVRMEVIGDFRPLLGSGRIGQ